MNYCAECETLVASQDLKSHLEENHVGWPPEEEVQLFCGRCPFRASKQNVEWMVRHCHSSKHSPANVLIEWRDYKQMESKRILEFLIDGVKIMDGNKSVVKIEGLEDTTSRMEAREEESAWTKIEEEEPPRKKVRKAANRNDAKQRLEEERREREEEREEEEPEDEEQMAEEETIHPSQKEKGDPTSKSNFRREWYWLYFDIVYDKEGEAIGCDCRVCEREGRATRLRGKKPSNLKRHLEGTHRKGAVKLKREAEEKIQQAKKKAKRGHSWIVDFAVKHGRDAPTGELLRSGSKSGGFNPSHSSELDDDQGSPKRKNTRHPSRFQNSYISSSEPQVCEGEMSLISVPKSEVEDEYFNASQTLHSGSRTPTPARDQSQYVAQMETICRSEDRIRTNHRSPESDTSKQRNEKSPVSEPKEKIGFESELDKVKRSWVRKYFEKADKEEKGKDVRVVCLLCRANLASGKRVGNIARHLESVHKNSFRELREHAMRTDVSSFADWLSKTTEETQMASGGSKTPQNSREVLDDVRKDSGNPPMSQEPEDSEPSDGELSGHTRKDLVRRDPDVIDSNPGRKAQCYSVAEIRSGEKRYSNNPDSRKRDSSLREDKLFKSDDENRPFTPNKRSPDVDVPKYVMEFEEKLTRENKPSRRKRKAEEFVRSDCLPNRTCWAWRYFTPVGKEDSSDQNGRKNRKLFCLVCKDDGIEKILIGGKPNNLKRHLEGVHNDRLSELREAAERMMDRERNKPSDERCLRQLRELDIYNIPLDAALINERPTPEAKLWGIVTAKEPKSQAWAWDYFEASGESKFKCLLCPKSSDKNTVTVKWKYNMVRHLRRVHRDVLRDENRHETEISSSSQYESEGEIDSSREVLHSLGIADFKEEPFDWLDNKIGFEGYIYRHSLDSQILDDLSIYQCPRTNINCNAKILVLKDEQVVISSKGSHTHPGIDIQQMKLNIALGKFTCQFPGHSSKVILWKFLATLTPEGRTHMPDRQMATSIIARSRKKSCVTNPKYQFEHEENEQEKLDSFRSE